MGYLTRLSEANGLATPWHLLDMMGYGRPSVVTPGCKFQRLQKLLGPLQVLPPDFGYHPRRASRSQVVLLGHAIHVRHLSISKARICPSCLLENGFAHAAWDLQLFMACPIHGSLLITQCPDCGRSLDALRHGLLECRCGYSLSECEQSIAPPEVIALMEVLDGKLANGRSNIVAGYALGLPIEQLLKCDMEVLCRIFLTLARVCSWIDGSRRRPQRVSDIRSYLAQAGFALTDWPNNFFRLCARWHSYHLDRGNCPTSFFKCFSWLFLTLNKNLFKRKHQTHFLLEAALSYGYRCWAGTPIHLHMADRESLRLPPKRYGSYREAAALLNMHPTTVLRWLSAGRLPGRALNIASKRPSWVIDLEALPVHRLSKFPQLDLREAARLAEVPHRLFRRLRDVGDIKCRFLTAKTNGVAREDVEEFVNSIVGMAKPLPMGIAVHSVSTFLNAAINIEQKMSLIRNILSSKVNVYRKRRLGIKGLYLDAGSLDDMMNIALAKRGERTHIPAHEAMRRHRLSYAEIRALSLYLDDVRMGGSRTKTWFSVRTLNKFLRVYTPLRCFAASVGVSRQRFLSAMNRRRVLVLRTKCIDKRNKREIRAFFIRRKVSVDLRTTSTDNEVVKLALTKDGRAMRVKFVS